MTVDPRIPTMLGRILASRGFFADEADIYFHQARERREVFVGRVA